jgi:hypothetical protein
MTFLRAIPSPAVSPRRSFSAKMGALAKEDVQCAARTSAACITEDVRRYAAEHGVTAEEAVKQGLEKKAEEFVKKGSQVYAKA